MQRNDGDRTGDSGQYCGSLSVDRRSYLKLAGTAAGAAGLVSGTAGAAIERRGIRFKRTVDMVADAGCDPTGEEPCDAKIRAAADDYTLLTFPPGEYKLTEKNYIHGKTNLGFLGEGDARFRVPENFNEKALIVDRGTGLLFEGIDIDQRADGATPGLQLGAGDDLRVHDVELLGQGIHPDSIPRGDPGWSPGRGAENGNPKVYDFFYPIVRSSSGTGVVTDVVANNHGLMGAYNAGNGRSGIWVGVSNKGTITFRNCRIEEFGSNGTYTSRTNGVVQFENGLFRNNDNNQIRVGSPGSSIEGAILDVDAESSDAPNPYDALNYRGVRIEMGRMNDRTDVTVRNCDIAIRSVSHSGGGVVAESTASEFTVENTQIGIEADSVCGILGKRPDGGGAYSAPAKPHAGTVRNTSVTGDASWNAAIKLVDRPNSTIERCCLDQTGESRSGVRLVESDGCAVRNTTIDVSGEPIVRGTSREVSVSDITEGGSCPAPEYGAGDNLPRKLSFVGDNDGGRFSYEFTVSGELGKSTVGGASIDDSDTASGSTAIGQGGGGGIDSYGFSGDVIDISVSGSPTLYLDGEEVSVGEVLPHQLSLKSGGGEFSYTVSASGDLKKSTAMGATIDAQDTISGSTAIGQGGGGGIDSYGFSGDLTMLEPSGDVTVYLDGERLDPSQYLDHVLTIEGTGSRATYDFSTADYLAKSTANNGSLNGNDEVVRSGASGVVGIGSDSYAFSGELNSFVLNGDAEVFLDGERIDPGQYPDHVLTIEGTGSRAMYDFSVAGDIAKSTVNGANINSNDDILGSGASGVVGISADSYTFSGDLNSLSIDGDANVFLDGERIDPSKYLDHLLTIEGTGSRATYEFGVAGALEKSTVNDASLNGNDIIDGSTASGVVGIGSDSYTFSGELDTFALDGDAEVYLDGERIDPAQYPDHVLTIEGTGSRATYEFSVSGDLTKSTANGASINANDVVSGSSTSGVVGIASDSYTFSGDLIDLGVQGDAIVHLDGSTTDLG